MNVRVSSEEQVLGCRSESVGIVCKSSGDNPNHGNALGSIQPTIEIRLEKRSSLN